MSFMWRCPSCGNVCSDYKCSCGHYRTDSVALNYDGSPYLGPRLCPYDQYGACTLPDVCHGNLINGHCACDADFRPKSKPTAAADWEGKPVHEFATKCVPMIPNDGQMYHIDNQEGRTVHDTYLRRTEEEVWWDPYCAVNRGHCAIDDSGSGETCRGVGFCIWRLASETFNPWAVDLCLQNTDNIITHAPDVGAHSPHYHEDANRYKEKQMATREQAYDDAMAKAIKEDQRKLDALMGASVAGSTGGLSTPNVVLPQEEVDRLLGRQELPLATTAYHDTRNPKDIAGSTKPQYHLIPDNEGLARVYMDGAKKYGAYNWREKRIAYTAYVSACRRHLAAFMAREDLAPDSLLAHIDHATACLQILSDAINHGTAIDDRPYNPKVKK